MSRARAVRAACLVAALSLAAIAASAPGRAPAPRLDDDGFQMAVEPYTFSFPFDHAAHPTYRSEWWYYTGHLRANDHRFGYELTFFRIALPAPPARKGGSAWRAVQIIFRHAALTDEDAGSFRYDDRSERQALDLAGADSTRYLVWLGDDYAGLEPDRTTHRLVGHTKDFALDLHLTPEKPPVIHGHDGVSRKGAGEGNASHYYSFTRLATRGRLVRASDTLQVEGLSWMDHEFGSDHLRESLAGWDWFAIQLSDGRDLMLYRLRAKGGGLDTCSSGTLVESDGRSEYIPFNGFDTGPTGEWVSGATKARYPSGWLVRVPGEALQLKLAPTVRDQELVAKSMGGLAYWEGSVRVSGTADGKPISGEGYVELTGYNGLSPFTGGGVDSTQRVR